MYACYVVYNNETTIRESLNSILPYVKKVIAIDGAWAEYPHKEVKSTDSTKEIFNELCGDKLIWVDAKERAWISQIEKRNEYLKYIPIGKWFIIIDGDEVIEGKVRKNFKYLESTKFKCAGIELQNHYPDWKGTKWYTKEGHTVIAQDEIPEEAWKDLKWIIHRGVARRLYKKLRHMQYKGIHSTIYAGKKPITNMEFTLKKAKLINYNYKRGWQKWQNAITYKARRIETRHSKKLTGSGIWVTHGAKTWLEKWLKPHHKGLEYGSGFSTVWLGLRVNSLVSIEYQGKWYKTVRRMLKTFNLKNVDLVYQPNLELFPAAARKCANETLDFVFIDGRERIECITRSYIKVKPRGIMIVDNSERPRYQKALKKLEEKGWKRLDFKGEGEDPATGKKASWQTSIFIKPKRGGKIA